MFAWLSANLINIALILFLAAAALNLAGTRNGRNLLFAITKPMLLSLLCLFSISRTAPEPDYLLIAALIACFVGDVLLLGEKIGFFIAGGLSFFAGHAMFIALFVRRADLSLVQPWILIAAAIPYLAAACAVSARVRKDTPLFLQIPLFLYLLCNLATNLFALAWLVAEPGAWQAAAFAGRASTQPAPRH